MSDGIEDLATEIGTAFENRSKRFGGISNALKWLLIFLSAIITAMHFTAGGHMNVYGYIGIGAVIIVLLISFALLVLDYDASSELEIARKAVEKARSAQYAADEVSEDVSIYEMYMSRAIDLYLSQRAMLDAVEASLNLPDLNDAQVITSVLEAGAPRIKTACGFELGQHYTIVIYEARSQINNGHEKYGLYPIAHDRAVKCEIANARVWPAGVGVGGYAYSSGAEVVVPDMNSPMLGSGFSYPKKDGDIDLYQSVAAVPVRLRNQNTPWGVVVATNDTPNHFSLKDDGGLQTVEAIRALATSVSLAIQSRLAVRPPIAHGADTREGVGAKGMDMSSLADSTNAG